MKRLKADLHTHTSEDPLDRLDYSAEMLIDAAAEAGVDVLAITCHEAMAHSAPLAAYAERRGMVLVPGVELSIENKHVIALNPDEEQAGARTFEELRRLGRRNAAFLAPHPFYPTFNSLGADLTRNIDLFDAVEYCTLYCHGLNLNRRACRVARRFGVPMVGTSDTHGFPYCDSTFTWLEAERSVTGVIEAVRKGRVSVVTRPRSPKNAAFGAVSAFRGVLRNTLGTNVYGR